jgi:hypothetical protein
MQRLTCIAISLAVLLTLAIAIAGISRPADSAHSTLVADGPAPFPECLPPLIPCRVLTASLGTNAADLLQLRLGFSDRQPTAVARMALRKSARLRKAA